MTRGDSGRGFVRSLELRQQSIYEDDDGTAEHDMPYVVTPQEIDKSSSVDSISNPYQQENQCSSATSEDSANLYTFSSQDVGDPFGLGQEPISHYPMVEIPPDDNVPPAPERCPAMPESDSPQLSPLPTREPPVIQQPQDCPDRSAWTDAQGSQQRSNTGASRTLELLTTDEASQAIASDLSKTACRSKKEMELAIKTSVRAFLQDNANKSRKRSPEGKDPEKQLGCRYCHKTKKTQCDLTYVTVSTSGKSSHQGNELM